MADSSEMIDIYNDNRELTGVTLPRKSKLAPGQYMMYVYALIEDLNGKYLITQRSLDKKWAAGQWEVPGGGAMAGESSLDAIRREVYEETGLQFTDDQAAVIYSYKNIDDGGDNYFADIYLIKKDFTLNDVAIDLREANEASLATINEMKQIHESDGFLHYSRIIEALSNT